MLSHEEARAFYNRFGSKQDWQRFYEDPAVADLSEHLPLGSATSVIEFGCGTGRLAERMLARHLPMEATYLVLDLLAESDISALIAEAHRVLKPGGLLGLVSLTHGFTFVSKIIEKIWLSAYKLRPTLVGGCRPITLELFLRNGWKLRHKERMISFGIPSAVLVAEKI
jgi:ubiquinone/menaquinone biosynthesis C-methylase UbiE